MLVRKLEISSRKEKRPIWVFLAGDHALDRGKHIVVDVSKGTWSPSAMTPRKTMNRTAGGERPPLRSN